MNGKGTTAGYQAPAVQKAFQLLEAIAESGDGIGMARLARDLGFSKSTTHGLIQALMNAGAVTHQPPGKKLCIGPAIPELMLKNLNYFHLQETAQPVLDDLRNRTGETVFLGALTRHNGIIVARADGLKPLNLSAPPGTTIPLLAGAVGKVFLAGMAPAEAEKFLRSHRLRRHTPRTIVNVAEYLAELDRVRKQHYALDREEYIPGVSAVAVGLGNHRGLFLALWMVGFVSSMDAGSLPVVVERIRTGARRLKQRLEPFSGAASVEP